MVALRIKEICKEKMMKLEDLAGTVGLSLNSMSCIVNGKQSPRMETLEKIAAALDVEITELFARTSSIIVCPHCGRTIHIEVK